MTIAVPPRHWRCYGDAPLPSPEEALSEPLAAFPSWWLRMECASCGQVRWKNQIHLIAWHSLSLREVVRLMRHSGCHGGDGKAKTIELTTDWDAVGKLPRQIRLVG